jgi:hypothetical protein
VGRRLPSRLPASQLRQARDDGRCVRPKQKPGQGQGWRIALATPAPDRDARGRGTAPFVERPSGRLRPMSGGNPGSVESRRCWTTARRAPGEHLSSSTQGTFL